MAVLVEMGFGDRPLNQRLLNKYNYNLLDVVNELVQMSDNDWYSTHYWTGGAAGAGHETQERNREVIAAHLLCYLSRSAHLLPISST